MYLVEGVGILRKISIANIKNEDIVTRVGNILWKLISIYDNIDPELAKLFADKNGQDAVVEILISKETPTGSVPYIKILNGLVQIPQLVSKMLDGGLAQTVKVINNLYPDDINVIVMNFDTMQKISNQKAGRDFLLKNKLVEDILRNVEFCAKKKNSKGVLSGLTVLDNLSRSDEGKNAIKEANGIACLCTVLENFENDDEVLKMCAKVYSKIATFDDLLKQLNLLKGYYNTIVNEGIDSVKFSEVNKCLVIISNFTIVDEMCRIICEKDNFKLIENLFIELNKIPLDGKDTDFISSYVVMIKYFMDIFSRMFTIKDDVYDKTTELGKEESGLLKKIQDSLSKIWDCVTKITTGKSDKENEGILEVFRRFFCSYNEIIYHNYKSISGKIDNEFINTVTYMISNVIIHGKKYFKDELRSNFIASRVLKTATDISANYPEITPSIESCNWYIRDLFVASDDIDTLSNCVDVLLELLKNKKYRSNNFDEIILSICNFMETKSKYRYPSLICLRILDMYLTPEFINTYKKTPDPKNFPSHGINYVNCIVAVMSNKDQVNPNEKVEKEIGELGANLLLRQCDMVNFKKILQQFKEQSESFNPQSEDVNAGSALEQTILTLKSIIIIRDYYNAGVEEILNLTKALIQKEVTSVELYKRDKEKMKNQNYNEMLGIYSNRIKIELELIEQLSDIAKDIEDNDNLISCYGILLLFLSKSTDISNIENVISYFNSKAKYLYEKEKVVTLEKNELITEKFTSTLNNLLRKLIEEEKALYPLMESMITYTSIKSDLCNILVKGGCPRMLLQITETTPHVKTAETALHLLKIITLSNTENLNMVAKQNILLKIFEIRAKYATNNNIITSCDLISNEIMKLPGQDEYAEEVLKATIKEFNENASLNYELQDTKQRLLVSIELINAFTTNQKQIELLLEGDFLKNLSNVFDQTLNDTDVSQLNEKLLTNELEILGKIKDEHQSDYEDTVKKLMTIITKKSQYRDIFLNAAHSFALILKDDKLYNKYLADKVNTEFIDSLFDTSENYLGDEKVSKEINNILCLLCVRNEKFAGHIKSRGGLVNVIEDLKALLSSNDENSKNLKLLCLKMLQSICNEESSMQMFIKANGIDLLNNIIKNEYNMLIDTGEIKDNVDDILFKTNETLTVDIKKPKVNDSDKETDSESESEVKEDYFVFCIRMIKSGIDKGYKEFVDDKQMRNLVKIANGKYPDMFLVNEICDIYSRDDINLPETEKDLFFLMRTLISIQAKYPYNKQSNQLICKLYNKMCDKFSKSENYDVMVKDDLKNIKTENLNDVKAANNNITYISLFTDINENYRNKYNTITKELMEAYNKLMSFYVNGPTLADENICTGVILCLMKIAVLLLEKKEKLDCKEAVDNFVTLSLQFFNIENMKFLVQFLKIFDEMLNLLGKNESVDHYTPHYLSYLNSLYTQSFDFLTIYDNLFQGNKDYSAIDEDTKESMNLFFKIITSYYSTDDNKEEKAVTAKKLLTSLLNIIEDFLNCTNIDENEQKEKLYLLWNCTNKVLLTFPSLEEETTQLLLSLLELTKNKNYGNMDEIFDSILKKISTFSESNIDILEKIINYITDDMMSTPPKGVDSHLETLSNLSMQQVTIKILLKKMTLYKKIRDMYDNENLSIQHRRIMSTIYSNIMKNSYNIDTIINDDPETFKSLAKKTANPKNVIKDEPNLDIADMETENIYNVMKDDNNYKQLTTKGLITVNDLKNSANNYKPVKEEYAKRFEDLLKKSEMEQSVKQERENLKIDKRILENLSKRIEKAFNDHLAEIAKFNSNKEDNKEDAQNLEFVRQMSILTPETENLVIEKFSNVKMGRLSLVSKNLFYPKSNVTINSPISVKSVDDISTALDSLLALVRLLYNNNKTCEEPEIKKEREELILEALKLLKMLSICSDNHKVILELGLLNFIERLVDEKDNNYMVYLACLDILKNCTWSENAVLILLNSPLLDKLLEEVLLLYSKPEEILKNDEVKSCFLYHNINLSNLCKCQKGFEIIFKKIGIEKLRDLGMSTGNIEFLITIIEMLINYINKNNINDIKNVEVSDLVEICKKALTHPEKTDKLFIKAFELLGLIYSEQIKDKVNELNLIQLINDNFEKNLDKANFIANLLLILSKVTHNNKPLSSAVVNTGLLEKLIKQVMLTDLNDTICERLSIIYYNLTFKHPENCEKMGQDYIIENIIFFIQKYSQRTSKPPTALMNTSVRYTLAVNAANNLMLSIENRILTNLVSALNCLTVSPKALSFLVETNFISSLLNTLDKPSTDLEIVKISLRCLTNYFSKVDFSLWKHSEVEQLYSILKAKQKQYYGSSEVLMNVNSIASAILKGFESRLYTERYYLLTIDSVNCQDWNILLIILTLKIMKQSLMDHDDLRESVFDISKQTIFNLLELNSTNSEVQILCYECLAVFSISPNMAYSIVNSDLLPIALGTMQNEDFNMNPEVKLKVRESLFNLLNKIAYDESGSKVIASDILDSLLAELLSEYSDDLIFVARSIGLVIKHKICVEKFIIMHGLETIIGAMNKNSDKPKFIIECFKLIYFVATGGEEYKNKLVLMKFDNLITNSIEKSGNNKVKFEGNILKHLFSKKDERKNYRKVDLQEISTEKMLKTQVKKFLTKGMIVKVVNPKGKLKEKHLYFSQDLMKICAKPPKSNFPPKAKYVIETPQIKEVVKGHGTDVFKKKKLFSHGPKAEYCFSIIGNVGKDGNVKSINVECDSEKIVVNWVSNIQMVLNYFRNVSISISQK